MGESASEDQEEIGRLRKSSPHSDLHRNYLIPPGCRCSQKTETSMSVYNTPQVPGISLTDTAPLEELSKNLTSILTKNLTGSIAHKEYDVLS